jgi:hypothetical protein
MLFPGTRDSMIRSTKSSQQPRPCEAASQSSRHLRSSDGLHHSAAHTAAETALSSSINAVSVQVLREEHYCLPVQPRASYDSAKASAAPKIDGNDLIPGHAVERTVGTKAQAAGSAELGRSTGCEDTDEVTVCCPILPNAGYRIRRAERVLAGDHDVAVGCHRKVERAKLRIRDQPRRLEMLTLGERNDGVVAFAIGADARGEE